VFVYGEDVAGMRQRFLAASAVTAEFGDRIVNSPVAESAVLGVCVGAALAGLRPIGEIQFSDFRRDRVQPAGQQCRQDALSVGRWGADGRTYAFRRLAARRAISLPEHRAMVLPDPG
jgi:pyruvate/2-oxoglutarate/acetoin dehydrogenase E1 component